MSRISLDTYFIQLAKVAALRSTCPRAAVGSIIEKDGSLISMGYNGAPKGLPHCDQSGCILDANGKCIRTIHSEINALLKSPKLEGCKIYVTHLPCLACSSVIINSGILEVIYVEDYIDSRCELFGIKSQIEYLNSSGICIKKMNL